MSRKPNRTSRWVAWSAAWAEAFGPLPEGFTAPLQLHVRGGRQRATVTARFQTAQGVRVGKLRLRQDPHQDAWVIDEYVLELASVTFKLECAA